MKQFQFYSLFIGIGAVFMRVCANDPTHDLESNFILKTAAWVLLAIAYGVWGVMSLVSPPLKETL